MSAGILDEAGFPGAKVVLWLPAAFSDPDFAAAAAKTVGVRQYPVLRGDPPDALAEWLQGEKAPTESAEETKIQIKTIASVDEAGIAQAARSQRIVKLLTDNFTEIALKLVDNPTPKPPPWKFWGGQFGEQLKKLPGNRAIIAIHDLDVTPGSDGSIEKQLQARFRRDSRCCQSRAGVAPKPASHA